MAVGSGVYWDREQAQGKSAGSGGVVSLPTFCGCEVEPGAVCVLLHEDGGWVGVRELPGACVVEWWFVAIAGYV